MLRNAKEKKVRITLDEFKSRVKTADLNTFFIFGAIILVLGIGLQALFSSTARDLRGGNPALNREGTTMRGPISSVAATQGIFGFGEQTFICPACNWRLKCLQQGTTYPNCPNCGLPMAKDMTSQEQQGWWSQVNPFGWELNTVAAQNSLNGKQWLPAFWQDFKSRGSFICPQCNWRMYAQTDRGEFPRCPNCKAIMAGTGVFNPNIQNADLNILEGGKCILR